MATEALDTFMGPFTSHLTSIGLPMGTKPNLSSSAAPVSGVIFVKRNARFCGIGSGLFGVGKSRFVFRLLFSSFC